MTDSHTTNRLDPGFLISTIPGSLGYHPDQCLIVFILHGEAKAHGGALFSLAASLRVDIDGPNPDANFVHYLCQHEPDLMLAFAIGDDIAAAHGAECAHQLLHHGMPLAGMWHVPELLTGASYHRVGGVDAEELGPLTAGPVQWDSGVIADIMAAPTMESFRRRGELPELTRADSFAFFTEPNPHMTRNDRRQLTKRGCQHARSFLTAIAKSDAEDTEYMVDCLLDDMQDVIDRVVAQQLGPDEICADDALIEQCTVYFSHPNLRDPLLWWAASDYAPAFFALCVAIARSTTGETRSNALCCAAMAASFIGEMHRVSQAMQLAHEATPRHRLTTLMMDALQFGGLEMLYQACHEGSDLARKALLKN